MFRRNVGLLVGVLMVVLVGVVPVGTAEADSIGAIDVLLQGVDETGAPVFTALGMGIGTFGKADTDGSFGVSYSYDAMYTDSQGMKHELMVSGTGTGQLRPADLGIAQAQDTSPAQMDLVANIVVDGESLGPVNIRTLVGTVPLNQPNPQVPGSFFSLANPVGPFTLPGLPPFIFPTGDHQIRGSIPEPAMLLVLGTGLTGLGALAWRRRRSG